ncbi:Serine/arginine-rich splicing factor 4, partial [Trichinella pseudospiralis]
LSVKMASSRVYIGRLPYRARERDVEDFFKGYGRIREILLKNGFGFVEFDDPRDADDAVYHLNGRELCGERIIVEMTKRPPKGRDAFRSSYRGSYGPPSQTPWRCIVSNVSTLPGRRYSVPMLCSMSTRRLSRGVGYHIHCSLTTNRLRPVRACALVDRCCTCMSLCKKINTRRGRLGRFLFLVWSAGIVIRSAPATPCSLAGRDLKDFMRQAGEVTYADAHRIKKHEGIVCFASHYELKKAIDMLNGKELNGRKLELFDGSRRTSRSRSHSSRSRSSRTSSSTSASSRSRSRSTPRRRRRSPSVKRSRKSPADSDSRSRSRSASSYRNERGSGKRKSKRSVSDSRSRSRSYSSDRVCRKRSVSKRSRSDDTASRSRSSSPDKRQRRSLSRRRSASSSHSRSTSVEERGGKSRQKSLRSGSDSGTGSPRSGSESAASGRAAQAADRRVERKRKVAARRSSASSTSPKRRSCSTEENNGDLSSRSPKKKLNNEFNHSEVDEVASGDDIDELEGKKKLKKKRMKKDQSVEKTVRNGSTSSKDDEHGRRRRSRSDNSSDEDANKSSGSDLDVDGEPKQQRTRRAGGGYGSDSSQSD